MSYEPLHHKYRPQTFGNLVGQEAIATTLTHAIQQQRIAPAYLFTGPRGTGKTSSARILAKSLNCLNSPVPTEKPCGQCEVCRSITQGFSLDVIEIDAASNTGVDNIRELIEKSQFAPAQCRHKVYIIDEVHMLSTAAFNALLKTLEEPPNHVVFILATTDPQRVLPTIISRCQRFDFRRIPLESMVKHLQEIAAKEGISITDEALTLVGQIAQGGLRDAESLLDQLSLLSGQITVERVWDLVGAVPEQDLLALLEAIADNNSVLLLERTRKIMDRGREPLTVLQNLAGFYRDLLIAKTAANRSDLVACTPMTWERLCVAANGWEISFILAGQERLRASEVQLKNTTQPRLWLEVTLLGLLPSALPSQATANLGLRQGEFKSANSDRTNVIVFPKTSPVNTETPTITPIKSTAKPIAEEPKNPVEESSFQQSNPSFPEPTSIIQPEVTAGEQNSQAVSQPPRVIGVDLTQIWQQMLNYLEPNSTRELLRQLGSLVAFENGVAKISVPQKWRKTIQDKQPNIEAAFQQALNYDVKVVMATEANAKLERVAKEMRSPSPAARETLAVAAPSHPASNLSLVQTVPAPRPESPVAEPRREEFPPNPLPLTPSLSPEKKAEFVGESTPSESLLVVPVSASMGEVLESDKISQEKEPNSSGQEVDEVAIAAQQVTEFFKGQVLKLTDKFEIIDGAKSPSLPAEIRQPLDPETAFISDVEEFPEDEEDPF